MIKYPFFVLFLLYCGRMYIEDHILSLIGFIDWLFVKRMAFSSPYSLSLYIYIYIY